MRVTHAIYSSRYPPPLTGPERSPYDRPLILGKNRSQGNSCLMMRSLFRARISLMREWWLRLFRKPCVWAHRKKDPSQKKLDKWGDNATKQEFALLVIASLTYRSVDRSIIALLAQEKLDRNEEKLPYLHIPWFFLHPTFSIFVRLTLLPILREELWGTWTMWRAAQKEVLSCPIDKTSYRYQQSNSGTQSTKARHDSPFFFIRKNDYLFVPCAEMWCNSPKKLSDLS